jgi:phosphatidylglycerophosphate synthase
MRKMIKNRLTKWELIADILTVSRLFFGVVIGLMGPYLGKEGIRVVIFLLLTGWITDVLDGKIARSNNKRKTWIGENEIRFDSFMLIGLIAYLGYSLFIPVWVCVSYAFLLFVLAVNPKTSYETIFLVEAPAAMLSLPILVYLEGTISILIFTLLWGSLLLIYDWDRAMTLSGIWKRILISIWQKVLQTSFFFNLCFAVLLFAAISFLLMKFTAGLGREVLIGISIALVVFCASFLWSKRG